MTFYVDKRLALGSIRFGVSSRRNVETIDNDLALSTGPTGEFVRRRGEGFFFGGHDRVADPTLPTSKSISSTPFLSSLKPDGTPRKYGFLASMAFGVFFLLLGLAVVTRKGPQGWVEVILGLIMIGTPIAMTAQERRKIREQEERERAEREATERRNRELLQAYTAALDRVRQQRDDAALSQLEKERAALTLPYEIWGAAARRVTLQIGFDELARGGPDAAADIAALMDRISRAAGLSEEDSSGVKRDLYRTVAWHILADDRLGPSQSDQLQRIQRGLGIDDADLAEEAKAVKEFESLRGVTAGNLPRIRCSTTLGFGESCIYETSTDRGTLHITNKRVLVEDKKETEIPLAHLFEINVDADQHVITVRTDNPKKPLHLRVEDAIRTAAMLDFASRIDERPRGFA